MAGWGEEDWNVSLHTVQPEPWRADNPTRPLTSIPRPRQLTDPRPAVSREARARTRARAQEARQQLALGIIVGFLVSDVFFVLVLVLVLRHFGIW
jgi:hypothetical protein